MGSELSGELVLLRPLRTTDLDALVSVFAEPEVATWWPRYDRERIEREMLVGENEDTTVFIVEIEGAVAGIIQSYEEPDREYRAASIDIALATAHHGKGVAVDALRTLARHLIEDRGHHHLTIDPAAHNARAIACYAKVGFQPVGILRQNEMGVDGTFHDALLMDLLASELR